MLNFQRFAIVAGIAILAACQVVDPHGTVLDTVHKLIIGTTTYTEATEAMAREIKLAKGRDAASALGSAFAGGPQLHTENASVSTVPGINGGTMVIYSFAESENGLFQNKNGSTSDVLTVTLEFSNKGILTNYDTRSSSQY